jgi:hypothetical protein
MAAPRAPCWVANRGVGPSQRAAGLALLLALVLAQQQQQVVALDDQSDPSSFTIIPDVDPFPPVLPVDAGYPGNLPPGLPKTLPAAPPVLVPGAQAACATTVREVLMKAGRGAFIKLLSSTDGGAAVLDGSASATVLAPTDAAIARLGIGGPGADPAQVSMFASYHVLQGKLLLKDMISDPGLWVNTTLTKAVCPTAYQTMTALPGNSTPIKCAALGRAGARARAVAAVERRIERCRRRGGTRRGGGRGCRGPRARTGRRQGPARATLCSP